jgi:neopullulanase
MVILHTGTQAKTLNTARFAELIKGFNKAKEVISGKEINNLNNLEIPAKSVLILELGK